MSSSVNYVSLRAQSFVGNKLVQGGSPGLVVMWRDSCSEGRKFESQYRILDGHFNIYLLEEL